MNRDTICVQGGYTPGNGEPRQIPIIQSTTFKYATSEDMGKLFDLEADGYFYSRLQNPTCDLVAKKICELEGGTAAMLTSSGQAANFFALFNPLRGGRPHRGVQHHLRRHLQPHLRHHEEDGHYRHLCGPAVQRGGGWTLPSSPTPRSCSARPSQTPPSPCWTLRSSPRPPTPTAYPSSWTTPSPHRSTAAPSSGGLTS